MKNKSIKMFDISIWELSVQFERFRMDPKMNDKTNTHANKHIVSQTLLNR